VNATTPTSSYHTLSLKKKNSAGIFHCFPRGPLRSENTFGRWMKLPDGWMDSLIYFIRGPATTTQASLRDRAYSREEWRESGRSAKYI
jgi:hypothetical protein